MVKEERLIVKVGILIALDKMGPCRVSGFYN